jgi:hypothetical protein
VIDGRLAEGGARQKDGVEPEFFDLAPALLVVREEVARDPDLLGRESERSAEERTNAESSPGRSL